MDFQKLILQIKNANISLQSGAVKAVNIFLTTRNWLIGYYIVEFEQNGEDRARYGVGLLKELAQQLAIKGLSETNLKLCRQLYIFYPEIIEVFRTKDPTILPIQIRQLLTDEFHLPETQPFEKSQLVTDQSDYDKANRQEEVTGLSIRIVTNISFTHLVELVKISDKTKRRFYELLILKTQPSVKELRRQINTLTYERLGLSGSYENSLEKLQSKIQPASPTDLVKSHYFFEFLDINQPHLIEENELEQALIDHLQQFIIELGNGFCFEARQKRLLIGEKYYFIDLVFYHRILKCHVLVDLKTDEAKHEHIGQLKTYLNYYKKNLQEHNDNPPVGILLVTEQNKTLVEYAIADSDKDLFVSQYMLQLPKKDELEEFLNRELKNITNG